MDIDKANREITLGHARADADSLRLEMKRYSELYCGCSISMTPTANKWHTCPLHKAAAALLEALEKSARDFHGLAARTRNGHKVLGSGIHKRSLVKVSFDECPEGRCIAARDAIKDAKSSSTGSVAKQ